MLTTRYILWADAANQTADGKLNVLGSFTNFFSPTVPFVCPPFAFVLAVQGDVEDHGKTFPFKFTFSDPSGKPRIEGNGGIIFGAKPPVPAARPEGFVLLNLANFDIGEFGDHVFRVDFENSISVELVLPAHKFDASKIATPQGA